MSYFIYDDDELYTKTKIVTEFSDGERREFEKELESLGITVRLQCRGINAGCPADLLDFTVDPPTRTKQTTPHYSGEGENGFREDHYSLKYAYDEKGQPTILKSATLCGCCSHLEIRRAEPTSEIRKRARKKLIEASQRLAEVIVLLGDKFHKLQTILTLKTPDKNTAIKVFNSNLEGRTYLEAISILGSQEWRDTVKQEAGEHDFDYEVRLKNASLAMLNSVIDHLDSAMDLELIDKETYEKVKAIAICQKIDLANSEHMPRIWLEGTTEMAVYSFLKPYGYLFVVPWFEAVKEAALEEARINAIRNIS